ncbi:MAG TPA: hypothetical protein VHW01_07255 [Polyangiaceae bacterium]|jgi:hypothetical protein|nr:hypothetical protein [Polyangiaceae bacterium]
MSRRARLTVLELGASPTAWASCRGLGTDDWIVVAQQRDEPAPEFTERVRQRARRLCKEDAQIESVDVYTAERRDAPGSAARRAVIEALGGQLAQGGRLTLWSASEDSHSDAELSAILAQFGPTLAKRQIAMNHQNCESEPRSGVRHIPPARPTTLLPDDFDSDDFGELSPIPE